MVAPIGDLFESFVKREADTKDSGGLFGAHGGALDRLDAVLFAAVVGYYIWVRVRLGQAHARVAPRRFTDEVCASAAAEAGVRATDAKSGSCQMTAPYSTSAVCSFSPRIDEYLASALLPEPPLTDEPSRIAKFPTPPLTAL